MLTIYRRHLKKCHHRSEGRKCRRCRCPIWVDGFLGRDEIRKSLNTRDWDDAQGITREWEAQGSQAPAEPADNRLTVEAAFEQYVADAESRQLGPAAIYKRRLLGRQMA